VYAALPAFAGNERHTHCVCLECTRIILSEDKDNISS